VPPAGAFLLVQKDTKDTPKTNGFWKSFESRSMVHDHRGFSLRIAVVVLSLPRKRWRLSCKKLESLCPKLKVCSIHRFFGGRRTSHLPIAGVRQQKEKQRVSARSEKWQLSILRRH
jgi:hypothetical protein